MCLYIVLPRLKPALFIPTHKHVMVISVQSGSKLQSVVRRLVSSAGSVNVAEAHRWIQLVKISEGNDRTTALLLASAQGVLVAFRGLNL